jgi:hypothetical protein
VILVRIFKPWKRKRIVIQVYWGKNTIQSYLQWAKLKGISQVAIIDEKNEPWRIRPQVMLTAKTN